jgi:hypothetical protein
MAQLVIEFADQALALAKEGVTARFFDISALEDSGFRAFGDFRSSKLLQRRQRKRVTCVADPLPQAIQHVTSFVCATRVECKILHFVGIIFQVEEKPWLPLEADELPTIIGNDPAPRTIDRIGMHCRNDRLQKGGIGSFDFGSIAPDESRQVGAPHPFWRGKSA